MRKSGKEVCFYLSCLSAALGGWFRMTEEMKEGPLEAILASGAIETENRSRAEAEGRISQALLKEGNYTIILEPATVRAGGKQYEEKRLMISAKESRDGAVPEEGMYLYAKGKAELFQEARNPGEFDYRLYYRSQKLRCRLRADKMKIISGERPAFQSQLIMFRRFVKEAPRISLSGGGQGNFSGSSSPEIRAAWTAIYGSCTRMEESPMFWL